MPDDCTTLPGIAEAQAARARRDAARADARQALRSRNVTRAVFGSDMRRRWVNAPSSHDRFFGLHGCNVIADYDSRDDNGDIIVYVVEPDRNGLPDYPIECHRVAPSALAIGWKAPGAITAQPAYNPTEPQ